MVNDGFKRRLSAILSADVAGYSRLMGEDDEGTVKTLTGHRQMMSSIIDRHQGRVIDSPGDNLLASFSSVTQAVDCAVEIQREMAERNAELSKDRIMEYRIGVNLGEVIEEADRIYGDGVNIAARLESLAEPGGICISGHVYSHVKNKIKLDYEFLGKQTVKNISEPVPVYCIKSLPKASSQFGTNKESISYISGKPSIAVLPFINMSHDPEQEYFSDGMSEEIIGALAKLDGLKVISRTSAFFFKGKDVDLRSIGEKLNVEHILEGSVRKSGNRIRIAAQLIRVADDTHLWAETFDRELEDVFAIQDEISLAVIQNIEVKLLEIRREPLVKTATENMDAYECFIKGRYFYTSFIEGGYKKAIQLYEQAIAYDPNYAPAYSAMAEWYWANPFVAKELTRDNAYAKAKDAINKALKYDDGLPEAYSTLGLIKMSYEWEWDSAEEAFKTALKLNPNSSKSHYDYAFFLSLVKLNSDKSIIEARKAIELDPLSGNAHYMLGLCYLVSGQIERAIQQLQHTRKMMEKYFPTIRALIVAYREGQMFEEAINECRSGLLLFPNDPILLSYMGSTYMLQGRKQQAQVILAQLIERSKTEYITSFAIAHLQADLGEIDKAIMNLEKGYEERDINLAAINGLLMSHPLRSDPRTVAILKKMGLSE